MTDLLNTFNNEDNWLNKYNNNNYQNAPGL